VRVVGKEGIKSLECPIRRSRAPDKGVNRAEQAWLADLSGMKDRLLACLRTKLVLATEVCNANAEGVPDPDQTSMVACRL
jgi:hypothetical protein